MENIFGGLIEFESEKDFDQFLDETDNNNLLTVIERSLEFAQSQNIFSIQETYFIYKCLKKIKTNYDE